MAIALAESSVHVGHSGLLLAAAGAFALLAVTARAPLGLARLCGPRLHGTLDIVVALAVALAPILPVLRPDVAGIVVAETAALAWVRVATLTRYSSSPVRGPAQTVSEKPTPLERDGPDSQTAPVPIPSTGAPSPAARRGAVVARGLGILAGRSVRRLPEAEEKMRIGARQAGRQAARLHRTWRKSPD